MLAGMLDKDKFRHRTWWVDAIQIWGSAGWFFILLLAGLYQGLGVAISLLIALTAFPLAFVSIVLLQHRHAFVGFAQRVLAGPNMPRDEQQGNISDHSNGPEPEIIDRQAYNDLVAFSIDYLLPACEAQISLQHKIIERGCSNELIVAMASGSLYEGPWDNFLTLSEGLAESPGPIISFEGMIDAIHHLEAREYWRARKRTNELLASIGIGFDDDEEIRSLWRDWQKRHNLLVANYEAVKRDSRFGKLLRPGRESRWGALVPPPAN